MKYLIGLPMILLVASSPVCAQKYLGNNGSKYDPNSVNNPYGRYGSRYSADSINNKYGKYGSKYSDQSVNNPYATHAPKAYNSQTGQYEGRVSRNPYSGRPLNDNVKVHRNSARSPRYPSQPVEIYSDGG